MSLTLTAEPEIIDGARSYAARSGMTLEAFVLAYLETAARQERKRCEPSFADGRFQVTLPDGGMFSFPIAGNWRLEGATHEQLNNVEVDDEGLHWPDIDEDLSFSGLLLGDHGQYVKRRRYA